MLLTVMFVLKSIEVCFHSFRFFTSVPNLFCTSKLNFFMMQKQQSRGVPRKRCSANMQQISIRAPMPKYDFNKVAKQIWWIFSEDLFLRTPLGGCFW